MRNRFNDTTFKHFKTRVRANHRFSYEMQWKCLWLRVKTLLNGGHYAFSRLFLIRFLMKEQHYNMAERLQNIPHLKSEIILFILYCAAQKTSQKKKTLVAVPPFRIPSLYTRQEQSPLLSILHLNSSHVPKFNGRQVFGAKSPPEPFLPEPISS